MGQSEIAEAEAEQCTKHLVLLHLKGALGRPSPTGGSGGGAGGRSVKIDSTPSLAVEQSGVRGGGGGGRHVSGHAPH
jgi:hypothetical protein